MTGRYRQRKKEQASGRSFSRRISASCACRVMSALREAADKGEVNFGFVETQPYNLAGIILAAMSGIRQMRWMEPGLADDTRLFMRLLRAAGDTTPDLLLASLASRAAGVPRRMRAQVGLA